VDLANARRLTRLFYLFWLCSINFAWHNHN